MKLLEKFLKFSLHTVHALRIELLVRLVCAQVVGKVDAHVIETGHFVLIERFAVPHTQIKLHTQFKRHFKTEQFKRSTSSNKFCG